MRFWEKVQTYRGKCSTESTLEEAKRANISLEKHKILKIRSHSDEKVVASKIMI